jgi:hypothetical protein
MVQQVNLGIRKRFSDRYDLALAVSLALAVCRNHRCFSWTITVVKFDFEPAEKLNIK